MRLFFICLFCSLFSIPVKAQQKKSKFILNLGFQHMSTYTGLFHHLRFTDGGYPVSQDGASFFDMNLLYTRRTKNERIRMVYGIGLNQKGFTENGFASAGSPNNFYPYYTKFKPAYFGIFAGASYDLVVREKTKLIVTQLLNPEIYIYVPNDLLSLIPLSARTTVTFEWTISKGFALHLTPYFQTAVTNYNKQKLTAASSNYRPYGFGMNFGLAFGE